MRCILKDLDGMAIIISVITPDQIAPAQPVMINRSELEPKVLPDSSKIYDRQQGYPFTAEIGDAFPGDRVLNQITDVRKKLQISERLQVRENLQGIIIRSLFQNRKPTYKLDFCFFKTPKGDRSDLFLCTNRWRLAKQAKQQEAFRQGVLCFVQNRSTLDGIGASRLWRNAQLISRIPRLYVCPAPAFFPARKIVYSSSSSTCDVTWYLVPMPG